ncbi:kinase-like domain-containing protein [Scleroderma yunnanense]
MVLLSTWWLLRLIRHYFSGLGLTARQHMVDGVHALTKLRHENIVPLLGVTTKFDGKISLVSEWMEKGNAHEYVQNCDVDPGPLLLGVASGLQYLHSQAPRPIFHGALKGSNILISPNGRALLADFGLFDSPTLANRVGAINWTSPERLHEPKGSAAGDVWAFAMTALELFTGMFPFASIRVSDELERRISQRPPDRPDDMTTCRRLTDSWWTICLLCWSQDPSLRPSIDQVIGIVEDELFQALRRRDSKRIRRMFEQNA